MPLPLSLTCQTCSSPVPVGERIGEGLFCGCINGSSYKACLSSACEVDEMNLHEEKEETISGGLFPL